MSVPDFGSDDDSTPLAAEVKAIKNAKKQS